MGAAKKYYLINLHNNTRLDIDPDLAIGREEFPDDKKMSKNHCEFLIVNNVVCIKDLESKNKTWINKEPIPSKRAIKLHLHDEVQIGRTKFKLLCDGMSDEELKEEASHTRKSESEFTFVLDNLSNLNEVNLEDSDEEMDENIAHTFSKIIKTTFGVIKQSYSSKRNPENEVKSLADKSAPHLILEKNKHRYQAKRGHKYRKIKQLEKDGKSDEHFDQEEFSENPHMLSNGTKLLVFFFFIGIISCILLSTSS